MIGLVLYLVMGTGIQAQQVDEIYFVPRLISRCC